MKLIFTLVVILFAVVKNGANAQIDFFNLKDTSVISTEPARAPGTKIMFTCGGPARTVTEKPLLVIDGIPYEMSELRKLNPDDIVSITILKEAAVSAIHSCRGARGVILITTKAASVRKFIIKDFLNGDKVPSATIYFTSQNDTVRAVANDSGILVTGKLKQGVEYEMAVSSAGYKSLTTAANKKEQEILLERDIKENSNVVVVAYPAIRCKRNCGSVCSVWKCGSTNKLKPKETGIVKPVYPNPVQRNNIFNLELENGEDETMQLSVMGLNGSLVSLRTEKINKGLNRLSITADPKWTAGIYNIQLRNEKGTLIRQEKLVVQ